MIDLLKPSIFPNNIIAGVATGYFSNSESFSYFETSNFNAHSVEIGRESLESLFRDKIYRFHYQKQIHSDIILIDKLQNDTLNSESDAIISDIPGVLYNVSIADCQAILIYDSVNQAVAAVHSGWKGTSLNIVTKTIETMKNIYNTNTKDLLVYLSPSANVKNYEVGIEFIDIFPETTIKVEDKYYYDNKKEIIKQLLDSGVLKNNIESNDDCTISNNRYHSFRRDKNKSGRMSAFIGISGLL